MCASVTFIRQHSQTFRLIASESETSYTLGFPLKRLDYKLYQSIEQVYSHNFFFVKNNQQERKRPTTEIIIATEKER
jgi:hypothetical protein